MNQGWPGQGPWLGQPLNRLSHLWSQPHWSGRIPVPRTEYGTVKPSYNELNETR